MIFCNNVFRNIITLLDMRASKDVSCKPQFKQFKITLRKITYGRSVK